MLNVESLRAVRQVQRTVDYITKLLIPVRQMIFLMAPSGSYTQKFPKLLTRTMTVGGIYLKCPSYCNKISSHSRIRINPLRIFK